MKSSKMQIGLVLSGGGARGIAHLGLIKALEENGVRISIVSGTSMGAIVGALYAAGITVDEMYGLFQNEEIGRFASLDIGLMGLLKHSLLDKTLRKHIPHNTFEGLKLPFFVSVSNLTSGKNEIYGTGELWRWVLASASIPVFFKPKKINGQVYTDGGLTNNLPVEPLAGKCDLIIGSHVNYIGDNATFNNAFDIGERAFEIAVFNTIRNNYRQCNIIFDPPELRSYGVFDFKHFKKIYDIGYQHAHEELPQLMELLKSDEENRKGIMERLLEKFYRSYK